MLQTGTYGICKANMATGHYQLLIVGEGAFGISTAYHRAHTHSDPSSIVVIDRTSYPPQHAAATDISKIFRADYHERFYMDLAFHFILFYSYSDLAGEPCRSSKYRLVDSENL